MTAERVIATCFYLGKLPYAPGSAGSLGALILWFFLPLDFLIHSIMILILFIVGVYSSKKVEEELEADDPSEIVIDEVVGMGISLFMLPHSVILYFLAFCIFRVFDIFKPSFIFHVQNLPGGWGVMLDDVLAGVFTLTIITGLSSI
jgi:phosphatidylglycerophosphatase A